MSAGAEFCTCSPFDAFAGAVDGKPCPVCGRYANGVDAAAASAARRARALRGRRSPRSSYGEFVDDHDAGHDAWVDHEPEPPASDEGAGERAAADAADRWIDELGEWESLSEFNERT